MSSENIGVLIIDDQPGEAELLKTSLSTKATVVVKHPSDVRLSDVTDAELILVDYTLEKWKSRDRAEELTQKPADGLAVISILESHTSQTATGYALFSANLHKLSQRLASPHREHVIARLHNIEWAFPKLTDSELLTRQIISLAQALRAASSLLLSDDPDESREGAQKLLGLNKSVPWHDDGWRDVERCFPPLYELSEASHGRAFVRWLAHRVMPYPTFAIESVYVGAALGISLPADEEVPRMVAAFLEPALYRGALSDLIGTRWWRAGVEYLLNEKRATLENPSELRKVLASEFGMSPVEAPENVVCVDNAYVPRSISPIRDAVRIQPDDWPAFADSAWMRIEDVIDDAGLSALVVEDDRHLVQIDR